MGILTTIRRKISNRFASRVTQEKQQKNKRCPKCLCQIIDTPWVEEVDITDLVGNYKETVTPLKNIREGGL